MAAVLAIVAIAAPAAYAGDIYTPAPTANVIFYPRVAYDDLDGVGRDAVVYVAPDLEQNNLTLTVSNAAKVVDLSDSGVLLMLPPIDTYPIVFPPDPLGQGLLEGIIACEDACGSSSTLATISNCTFSLNAAHCEARYLRLEYVEAFLGDGNDVVHLAGAGSQIYVGGAAGSDQLFGGAGRDFLFGGDGDDRILGAGRLDELSGNDGSDRVFGGPANDYVSGDAGADVLRGNDGDDTIVTGGISIADGAVDVVDCGAGFDYVLAEPIDQLTGCENVEYY